MVRDNEVQAVFPFDGWSRVCKFWFCLGLLSWSGREEGLNGYVQRGLISVPFFKMGDVAWAQLNRPWEGIPLSCRWYGKSAV